MEEKPATLIRPNGTGFNVNSILSALLLAAMVWVANKTASTNDAVVEIKTQLPYMNSSVARLEVQIATFVTRAEAESRFAEVGNKFLLLDKRLIELESKKAVPP